MFELEPRYAGQSYPTDDVATIDLRYNSIDQKYMLPNVCKHVLIVLALNASVADVVAFITNKSALLPNSVLLPKKVSVS